MKRAIFLLEERSMKALLDTLLPRLFPGLPFLCVPHEGKQDLDRSIPRKLKAWREPGVHFVVVRDNDGQDCIALKRRLTGLCRDAGREDTLVRIACQELEAWYLGEPSALAAAFHHDDLRALGARARFRDPDAVARPALELRTLVPGFQKVSGARRMAHHLTREHNRSRSFQAFIQGINGLARSLADEAEETL